MNNTIGDKQLQEFLVNLGFISPDLVDLADDWLKPILLDSIEYQKLMDRMISANGKLEYDKQITGCFSPIVIITAIWEWFFRIRDRSKAGKSMVKWLWGSLTTAPQPKRNRVPQLYALEVTFTSGKTGEFHPPEKMSTARVSRKAFYSAARSEQENRGCRVSRSKGMAISVCDLRLHFSRLSGGG